MKPLCLQAGSKENVTTVVSGDTRVINVPRKATTKMETTLVEETSLMGSVITARGLVIAPMNVERRKPKRVTEELRGQLWQLMKK